MADQREDTRRAQPPPRQADDVPGEDELRKRIENGETRERPPAPRGARQPLEETDQYGGPGPMGGPEAVGFDPEAGPSPHPEGSPAPIGVGTLDRDTAGASRDPELSDVGAMSPEEREPEDESR